MTIKDAKAEVSKLGMALSRTEHGEFRVNFKGGSEETAYYTDDLGDAVGTAKAMKKKQQPNENGHPISRMNSHIASKTLDRISDHLEALRQEMPREASNIRGMVLRLDRVANTLEAEQEDTERVSKIESELDGLGVDFTVAPNSSGKKATCIYAYKGQLGSNNEAAVLSRIAKKHGSTFEDNRDGRTYRITVPHNVRV